MEETAPEGPAYFMRHSDGRERVHLSWLGQSKNRSGLNWFLISLLLGPLATFFVVILDPLRKT
jgi:hypothetical protein